LAISLPLPRMLLNQNAGIIETKYIKFIFLFLFGQKKNNRNFCVKKMKGCIELDSKVEMESNLMSFFCLLFGSYIEKTINGINAKM
jgi:hypothetical protein